MDTQRPTGEVERSIASLADLRLSDQTLDSILGHIGALAVRNLAGWDAAATSILEGDKIATFGSTDRRIDRVDQAQYDHAAGPCVDASQTGETKYFDGTSIEPRWRDFAEIAGDAGVYSVISFPLKVEGDVLGALNLYSGEREALRSGQREEGSLFAAQAAVSLANAKDFLSKASQVEQLEEALETRTMIGQATGLLMAQEGLTSDEAFQRLVKVSQNANLKLRDISQRYVDAWEEKAGRAP